MGTVNIQLIQNTTGKEKQKNREGWREGGKEREKSW